SYRAKDPERATLLQTVPDPDLLIEMRITRRTFLQTALAMPLGAAFTPYQALAAPAQGLTKITKIQALQLKDGRTLIRVDTDAGLSGYGECNTAGPAARSAIA